MCDLVENGIPGQEFQWHFLLKMDYCALMGKLEYTLDIARETQVAEEKHILPSH